MAKSPARIHTRIPFNFNDPHPPYRTPLHSHSYSHSHSLSFKDVESLLTEENPIRNSSSSSIFHRARAWAASAHRQAQQQPPEAHNRVVVYYTSLRVVRKTFEDCRTVRSILKTYRTKIDERDLSMDKSYVAEFLKITKDLILPRVFVNGKYVGGVDEIRRLHETGNLKRLIQGLPAADVEICGGCGGFRFTLCEWCYGSRRVYIEEIQGFKICSKCNENGLIRCSSCTSVVF